MYYIYERTHFSSVFVIYLVIINFNGSLKLLIGFVHQIPTFNNSIDISEIGAMYNKNTNIMHVKVETANGYVNT